jgi:hypothetical protein
MPGEIQPHDLVVSSEVRKLIIPEAAVATPAMHKHQSGFIVVAGHMVPDRVTGEEIAVALYQAYRIPTLP